MEPSNNTSVQTILSILRHGALPGSSIFRELEHREDHSFSGREAQLYPLLHTMEKQGLIRGRTRTVALDIERRFYTLTRKGKQHLPPVSEEPVPSAYRFLPIGDMYQHSVMIIRLRRWCSDATLGIQVSPDREIVARELFGHIYDRISLMLESGVSPEEAEKSVCIAQGDYREVSNALGRIHRPFWTKALRYSRYLIACLTLIACFCYGLHFLETHFFRNTIVEFDSEAGPPIAGTQTLLWESRPGDIAISDGYIMTASRAALWDMITLDGDRRVFLNLQLKITNPIPWAERPDFAEWIWAEDSLGNLYQSPVGDTASNEPALQIAQYHTGPITYIEDIWIYQYVSREAEWIDLHYHRSGRDIVLRIELNGGKAQ